jgi:hypothetical protein
MTTKGAVQSYNTKMDEVRHYLRHKNLPVGQRRAIEAHFRLLWQDTAMYDERQILALMPRVLRDPIIAELYGDAVGKSAFFARLRGGAIVEHGDEVLFRIAQRLTPSVSNSGLAVMMEGECGQEMYFIDDGEVRHFFLEFWGLGG